MITLRISHSGRIKISRAKEKIDQARSLMVYRVGETSGEKKAHMTKEMVDFNFHVAKKEKEN
ncbi:hypothetical protein ACFMJ4_20020, partial [Acinetobacter baumannii]